MIVTTYHYFERTWSIIRVVSLDSHDIRPWDFNLILKTTIKDFPYQLMLRKVTLRHQVSFISRLILQKLPYAHQSQYHIIFVCIVLNVILRNYERTSQFPIFKMVPGKLEALSLESAAAAAAAATEEEEEAF